MNQPWRDVKTPLEEINPISSMISPDESRYLHWLTSKYYTGEGEIIDAGCLLGGSTLALASGLDKNEADIEKEKRIHSFDIFTYFPDYDNNILRDVGHALKPGDSMQPLFDKNTRQFSDYISVHAGDFCELTWSGKPIEVCFVDLAKLWSLGNHVIQEFFSCLIPGRSVLLHQDYLHHFCYWIHLTMEFFGDYFERIFEPVGGTVSFRLLKPIPEELLRIDFERYFSLDEATRLMDRAIDGIVGPKRLMIATAKMKMLADRQAYEAAAALSTWIRDAEDFGDFVLFDLFQAEKYLPPDLVLPSMELSAALKAGSRNYSIFEDKGILYAVHRTCDSFTLGSSAEDSGKIIRGSTLADIQGAINEKVVARPTFFPILLEKRDDYQVVWFNNRYYCVPNEIPPIQLTLTKVREQCRWEENLSALDS